MWKANELINEMKMQFCTETPAQTDKVVARQINIHHANEIFVRRVRRVQRAKIYVYTCERRVFD
jgi:hypothetical protein